MGTLIDIDDEIYQDAIDTIRIKRNNIVSMDSHWDWPLTDEQMKCLFSLFNEAGIKDRDLRLAVVADLFRWGGIKSFKDFTKWEASILIDQLKVPVKDGKLSNIGQVILSKSIEHIGANDEQKG